MDPIMRAKALLDALHQDVGGAAPVSTSSPVPSAPVMDPLHLVAPQLRNHPAVAMLAQMSPQARLQMIAFARRRLGMS